jgi:hypothetical protein
VTAFQFRFVLELVVPEAVNPAGTAGAVEQLEQGPVAVQGSPLPAPPLLVVGFWFCVQKLAT